MVIHPCATLVGELSRMPRTEPGSCRTVECSDFSCVSLLCLISRAQVLNLEVLESAFVG